MAFSSSTVSIGASTKQSDYQRLLDNTQDNRSRVSPLESGTVAISHSEIQTFQSGTVFEVKPKVDGIQTRSATGSVSIECEYFSSAGNSVVNLKTKVVEIGDWDMDTTQFKTVLHGLSDHKKVRTVNVFINEDIGSLFHPLGLYVDSTGLLGGGVDYLNSTGVILRRVTGGLYDNANFNSTPFNRGWITITYEA